MVPNLITEVFCVRRFKLVNVTQRCSELVAGLHNVLPMSLFHTQIFNPLLVVMMKCLSKIIMTESACLVKIRQRLISPHPMFLLEADQIFGGNKVDTVFLFVSGLQ